MKRQELAAYVKKSAKELAEEIAMRRVELGKLKLELKSGRQKNLHVFLAKRRDIARLLTLRRLMEVSDAKVK